MNKLQPILVTFIVMGETPNLYGRLSLAELTKWKSVLTKSEKIAKTAKRNDKSGKKHSIAPKTTDACLPMLDSCDMQEGDMYYFDTWGL
jgi:hypothetical protein